MHNGLTLQRFCCALQAVSNDSRPYSMHFLWLAFVLVEVIKLAELLVEC